MIWMPSSARLKNCGTQRCAVSHSQLAEALKAAGDCILFYAARAFEYLPPCQLTGTPPLSTVDPITWKSFGVFSSFTEGDQY